jgi:hypothetical protein
LVDAARAPWVRESNLRAWFTFLGERQQVYVQWLRNATPPWSSDEALLHGRFCNVFRFLDRESVYVRSQVIQPLQDDAGNLLFNVILFRAYLNSGDAMRHMGLLSVENFSKADFLRRVQKVQDATGKVSNAAYNVGSFAAFQSEHAGPGCKPARAAAMFRTLAPLMRGLAARITARRDSRYTFEQVRALPGVGEFVGYQICVDIGYWRRDVYDDDKHVILGPGAKKGLRWLFKPDTGMDVVDQLQLLRDVAPRYLRGFPIFRALVPDHRKLGLMEVENALCEGHKYFRFHSGTGRFKQGYTAHGGASDEYKQQLRECNLVVFCLCDTATRGKGTCADCGKPLVTVLDEEEVDVDDCMLNEEVESFGESY